MIEQADMQTHLKMCLIGITFEYCTIVMFMGRLMIEFSCVSWATMYDKSRVVLTLEEKRKVILESKKEISARKLAKILKCSETQVTFNIL